MGKIGYRLLIILLCAAANIAGAYAQDQLVYPTKNYTIEDYKAGTQNWSVAELDDGTICLANNNGLLVKNGKHWSVWQTPQKLALRVLLEYNSKIYVGGKEFGYFTKDFSGNYKYSSLSNENLSPVGEIWRIEVLKDYVYFQGDRELFIYDTKTDSLVRKIESKSIRYFTVVEDCIYIQTNEGLLTANADFSEQEKLCKKEELEGKKIRKLLSINGQIHIVTLKNGIYQLANKQLLACQKPINRIIADSRIYCAIASKNKLVFGTILDGIYVLDKEFNIIRHQNTASGLQNNTILSLGLDHNQNVWVGYDNGVGFIDINARYLHYAFDINIGSGYASIKQGSYRYWGTNQGLFYTNEAQSPGKVHLVAGTEGQVWRLVLIGGVVYCGHHNGLYKISEGKASKLLSTQGIMNIVRLSANSELYFLKSYHKLLLCKDSPEGLQEVGQLSSPIPIPRDIKLDSNGRMWFAKQDSVYSFEINTDTYRVDNFKTYAYPGQNGVFSFGGDILLWNGESLLKYDKEKDTFIDSADLVCTNSNSKDLIELFYSIPVSELYDKIDNCDRYIKDLAKIKEQIKWNVQIASADSNAYILNSNDGFINFNYAQAIDTLQQLKLLLSEIKVKSRADAKYQWIENNQLPYSHNNIQFEFNSNDSPYIEYQYKLVGYDESYSSYSPKNIKEYTNLSEGTYRFEIIARDLNGKLSPLKSFSFSIAPPFYRSNIAMLIYAVLCVIVLILMMLWIKFLLKRKEKQLNKLRQKEIEELEKTHKIDTLSKEKKIILMEKERLEEAVEYKQRELTNSTHNIIAKNNLLIEVKDLLESMYKEKDTELRDSKINKIFHQIDSKINNKEDWAVFENYFSEIHQTFFENIKKDFPELSPTDLKLCAYIRLNKSTKEIASLMNISVRGVETSRYRLRKKLGLDRKDNIYTLLSRY